MRERIASRKYNESPGYDINIWVSNKIFKNYSILMQEKIFM